VKIERIMLLVSFVLLLMTVSGGAAETLVFVHNGAVDMLDYYDEMFLAFERENPGVKIDRQVVNIEKLRVMLASGAQVDVIEWWPEGAAPLFAANVLMNLDSYVAREPGLRQRLVQQRLESFTWNGELIGLPFNANVWAVYYNSDLLAAAGLAIPPQLGEQWNWSTLLDYCKHLTVDRNGDGVPEQWCLRANNDIERWPTWLHNAGGSLFDQTSNPTKTRLSDPRSMAGLRFFASLYQEHRATALSGVPAFNTGNVAFWLDGGPMSMSDLVRAEVPFSWGYWKRPLGPANDGSVILGIGFMIPRAAKNVELSWKLIRYLAVRPESIERMYKLSKRTPAYIPLLANYSSYLRELFGPGATPIPEIVANPANMPGLVSVHRSTIEPVIQAKINSMLRGETAVENVIAELEQQVNALLQE
jgi:ABC-type glycerol-3-phosphate transport system substrate-binding protein